MEDLLSKVREKGGRVTKIKREIIHLLLNSSCLQTTVSIRKSLNSTGLSPNRTTLYRELLTLVKNGIVTKSHLSGIDYYEIPSHHHHHLICLECNAIQKVDLDDQLHQQEEVIQSQTKFKIINHSLEFYGYCQNCH